MARPTVSTPYRDAGDPVGVVQRQVHGAINDLASVAITQGKPVKATLDSTKTVLVSHGLGRRWVGWVITDLSESVTVYRDATSLADPALYLPLKVSASAPTVTLWVF